MTNVQKLDFPGLPYGTHEARHDLNSLLHHGAAEVPAHDVMEMIGNNEFGAPDLTRLPLVTALHAELSAQIARGMNHVTVKNRIYVLRIFYSWCDKNYAPVTSEKVADSFRGWVEHLIHRVRVEESLKNASAYSLAKSVDSLLKSCLNLRLGFLPTTRLSSNSRKRKVLGSEADKQNLEETFIFGSFLMDVVSALSTKTLTGSLPIIIPIRSGQALTEFCGNHDLPPEKSSQRTAEKNRFIERRAPIPASLVFEKRHSVVNLRIEAELLIFVSQTGMNLSQAANLAKGKFRYKTNGDDILVYRVYKGRRGGNAEFCIFKEYAPVFKAYLAWLEELSAPEDLRLFPFFYPHKIPVEGIFPRFQGVTNRCAKLGIKCYRPRALRKTRVNWLLRKSRDPDLVAEMAQHTKEVLLSVYEEPHHQSAAAEISRFYREMETAVAATGPGMCVAKIHPVISNIPSGVATKPDCSTPAGCLFCEFQRDVDSEDYVWSLTTYKYLKMLELDRYVPPQRTQITHPAVELIERLQNKLQYFSELDECRGAWVDEAAMRMREGRFHPDYEGLIQLMELA